MDIEESRLETRVCGARIASTAIVHPNVKLGDSVTIEDFCVIGYPPKGVKAGELPTIIGDGVTVRTHSLVYAGTSIGDNCHVAHHAMIREHVSIGDN